MDDPERGVRKWRPIGRSALVGLTIALILVSFLPLWWTDRWWVRIWDFPRLQVAALLFVATIGLYFMRLGKWGWPLIGAAVAALVWQATHFVAYFPPYPNQVAATHSCPEGRQISLLSANVLMTNRQYGKLIELVAKHRPDVLLLLEPGPEWAKAIEPLKSSYPNALSEPLPNTYGLILMSRLPMTGRIEHLLQPGIPSANVRIKLRSGEEIDLHAVHPEPPTPGDDSGERDAELVMVGREVRNVGRAAVVVGDLNDVAWSRTSRLFRRVAGMGDPRVGRGLYPTFNAKYPLLRWPLDHLYVSPHFDLMSINLLPDIGSDHFPIFFRLCLKDHPSERQVAPSASAATEAEATGEVQAGKAEDREEQHGR
jgi:endonuclease/exonuclease/phosphatase (EEP) superfamily protein YafD